MTWHSGCEASVSRWVGRGGRSVKPFAGRYVSRHLAGMGSGVYSFHRRERLRTDREYREVVRKGERTSTSHFNIYRDFPGGSERKIGVSVGKRAGKAVVRNRVKRVLREFYRFHKNEFPLGSRTAITVKKTPESTELAKVTEELLPAIARRWGTAKDATR